MDMSECSSPYKLFVVKRFMQRWGPHFPRWPRLWQMGQRTSQVFRM